MQQLKISVEQFSSVIAAIHAATASSERWVDAVAAVARIALASLDRLAVPAFIVNRAAVVHHLNASARALLATNHCVRLANAGLRFNHADLNAELDRALRVATQAPPQSTLLPLFARDAELCEVAISPLEAEPPHGSEPMPLVLVTMARSRPDSKRIVERVRRLYGLTDAEARVMAELALGGTVEAIAQEHRVRASTVRAQVRSVFDKTGVNRQSDLVRLALCGAPLMAGRDA